MTDLPTWMLAYEESPNAAWEQAWFLDGAKATVEKGPGGLVLESGPTADDTSHCVLWTKAEYAGDIRVEFDFTRLDGNTNHVSVCIFYMQATGSGQGPYAEDLAAWADLRTVPSMSLYFKNLNCYHFSYACTGGKDFNYVRARRYPQQPGQAFDASTRILPSYDKVDLFHPGETWHLAFKKRGTSLSFEATRDGERHLWAWAASGYAPISHGRLGLRQMCMRKSRYANFKVWRSGG